MYFKTCLTWYIQYIARAANSCYPYKEIRVTAGRAEKGSRSPPECVVIQLVFSLLTEQGRVTLAEPRTPLCSNNCVQCYRRSLATALCFPLTKTSFAQSAPSL